ncbi:MAG: YggS family pyridoxal phosphate-dependent enzyme [Thiohalorhabdus sp.]|uniref:YggS family pyridoxal phosphate-dependent enzyme n=1 Tax=Thiohalorhabdus sp. TaxID=3094134 RepID=UPI00397F2C31
MDKTTEYRRRLEDIRGRIAAAARRGGRDPEAVTLLAVSKTFPAGAVRALAEAGQRAFAESYAQEAEAKQADLADLALDWHFIGPLQSNKAGRVAAAFPWVHSVDRAKIGRALERHRAGQPPLNVCLQVNVSGEASKSGCAPEEARELAVLLRDDCPHLRLRGLMAIPAPGAGPEDSRPAFRRLAGLLAELREAVPGPPWDTLSMGMSGDFEVAVEEGATHVRVGSALFGERAYPGNAD